MDNLTDGIHRRNGMLGQRAMRTKRMKIVIQEAARLGERKGTENLTITK